jgi:hypothetical protein
MHGESITLPALGVASLMVPAFAPPLRVDAERRPRTTEHRGPEASGRGFFVFRRGGSTSRHRYTRFDRRNEQRCSDPSTTPDMRSRRPLRPAPVRRRRARWSREGRGSSSVWRVVARGLDGRIAGWRSLASRRIRAVRRDGTGGLGGSGTGSAGGPWHAPDGGVISRATGSDAPSPRPRTDAGGAIFCFTAAREADGMIHEGSPR